MLNIGLTSNEQIAHLSATIARRTLLSPGAVLPFADLQDLLPHLLAEVTAQTDHLISAGHVSLDIVIAADHRGLKVSEALGVSPFAASVDAALAKVVTGSELVYVANPNRITGSNLGLTELEMLVRAVPRGFVLIDEYYFDYFGITGLTLLERYSNIGILRSFAAAFGVESSESGFFAGSPELVGRLRGRMSDQVITHTIYRTAMMTLESDAALQMRLKTLHDEALRISTELTRRGLQNRITAADFLLLRVKEPTTVGNHLARHKIPCENLDGYPLLGNYLRYKLQSPLSNDRLLDAIGRIAEEAYRMTTIDRRMVTLRRPTEMVVETPLSKEPVAAKRKPLRLIPITDQQKKSKSRRPVRSRR